MVQNHRELAVLKSALQFQQKKLWTTWLNADGLTPVAMGLRLARNLIGGGERATVQLEIARLALRQAEVETQLRDTLARTVLASETAQQQVTRSERRLATHRTRLQFSLLAYRFGAGHTDTMLQLWQTETELQTELEQFRLACQQQRQQLYRLVFPYQPKALPTSPQNQPPK